MPLRFALALALCAAAALPGADLSSLKPGARASISYPALGAPLVGGVATVQIGLPPGFDPAKTYGIYLWYNGGGGGAGIDDTFAFSDRSICLSLPLFRRRPEDPRPALLDGGQDPAPGDIHLHAEDWYRNWTALEAVMRDLRAVAPHIDPDRSYCGGYSNGGHNIGFMASHSPGFCALFKGYLFIEGGCDGYNELSSISYLMGSDKSLYIVGGEKSAAGSMRAGIYEPALRAKIDAFFLFEPGVGHAYDQQYKGDTRKWIVSHIFYPGVEQAATDVDALLARKRASDAVRVLRGALAIADRNCPQWAGLERDLTSCDAAAAEAVARVDLGTSSASALKRLLGQWQPCPAAAAVAARIAALASAAQATLPASSSHQSLEAMKRFVTDWAGTPAAQEVEEQLVALAKPAIDQAEAQGTIPKRIKALLAVAKAWATLAPGTQAMDAAIALGAEAVAKAVAEPVLEARGRQEYEIAQLLPGTQPGMEAAEDVAVLSQWAARTASADRAKR